VEAFFEAAREDVDLQLQLRQEGILFFLHLLGNECIIGVTITFFIAI
jgi:hypothetical protein